MTCCAPAARWTVAALAAALALAEPSGAQTGGKGFLFREPPGSFSIRGGLSSATARSDLFDEVMGNLTLDRGDFLGGAVAADVGIALPGTRLELVLGTGFATTAARSEYRDFVEEGPTTSPDDDLPIAQTTTFRRIPVTAGIKAYLTSRGRTIGRFAWVPSRVTPYLGAGGGATWYRFRQEGDFMDFETLNIATRLYESSGWGPLGYVGGGLDVTLSPHVALTADARYQYAWSTPNLDFADYDRMDLSGVLTTLGFNFRF